MMKIARNLYLSKIRSEKNRTALSLDELEQDIPYEQISQMENRMAVERLFRVLDEEERVIIVLHLVEDTKFRDIARIMDKPLGTVLSKYNRGLKKMNKADEE